MRNLLTRKRYDELTLTLRQLREIELPRISAEKQACAEQGDLRENAGYEAARDKLELTHRRIHDYEEMLAGAEFIEDLAISGEIVSVGTIVELTDLATQEKETYKILGPADSDPQNGVISFQTPLARGLIGKAAGTTTDIDLPGGKKKVKIESIKVYKGA